MFPFDQVIRCPSCGTMWRNESDFFYAIVFINEPYYNHLVWVCPSDTCVLGMVMFVSQDTFGNLLAGGIRTVTRPDAPATMRMPIRYLRNGADNPDFTLPIDVTSVDKWSKQLQRVDTADDMIRLMADPDQFDQATG